MEVNYKYKTLLKFCAAQTGQDVRVPQVAAEKFLRISEPFRNEGAEAFGNLLAHLWNFELEE